jgi:hypothetical protein
MPASEVSAMDWGMLLGGAILVGTQIAIVVTAIIWYRKRLQERETLIHRE